MTDEILLLSLAHYCICSCSQLCLRGFVFQEITDESLGYIKNGVVILEAMIKAELPRKLQ